MTAPRRMTATGIGQAADVSPAAARGASEGARMVRALSQGRLHDRDRVRGASSPTARSSSSCAGCRPPTEPKAASPAAPDLVGPRSSGPYRSRARIEVLQLLAPPFPGGSPRPRVRPRVAPRAGGPRSGGPCASFKNAPDTRPKRVFGAQEAQKAFPNLSISFHFWRRFETYQLVTGARPAKVFFFPPSPEQDRPRSQIPQLLFRYAASSETMICSFAAGAGLMLHPCFRACLPERDA